MSIVVCPLSRLEDVVAERRPSHVITLLDPDHDVRLVGVPLERHLRIGVHDVAELVEGYEAPSLATVERILEFGRDWNPDDVMVVHCWAGVSRSTATAFVLACAKNPQADEREIARELRRSSPSAYPNPLIVALADALLGRDGRMIDALKEMGLPSGDSGPFELRSTW
jgi:predicted protein tyrosine phosphatase